MVSAPASAAGSGGVSSTIYREKLTPTAACVASLHSGRAARPAGTRRSAEGRAARRVRAEDMDLDNMRYCPVARAPRAGIGVPGGNAGVLQGIVRDKIPGQSFGTGIEIS